MNPGALIMTQRDRDRLVVLKKHNTPSSLFRAANFSGEISPHRQPDPRALHKLPHIRVPSWPIGGTGEVRHQRLLAAADPWGGGFVEGLQGGLALVVGAFLGTIRICSDQAKVRAPCWRSPYARLARAR
jgi:hypothetical protein